MAEQFPSSSLVGNGQTGLLELDYKSSSFVTAASGTSYFSPSRRFTVQAALQIRVYTSKISGFLKRSQRDARCRCRVHLRSVMLIFSNKILRTFGTGTGTAGPSGTERHVNARKREKKRCMF